MKRFKRRHVFNGLNRLKRSERFFWILLLGVSLSLNASFLTSPLPADLESYHKYQHVFQNVYHYLRTRYVEKIDEKDLMIGAIRGMMKSTGDPYTRFLNRKEHEEFNSAESGSKVGIGVQVTLKKGLPLVISPIEGGPAAKAGIHAGDLILKVDGIPTRGKNFGFIIKMLSGKLGSVVKLEIGRAHLSRPLTIQVTRGLFKLNYVRSSYLARGRVGYLRLTQFFGKDAGTLDMFKKTLADFKAKNVKGIIVDLRGNSGGHLDLAGSLTGLFLRPGQVIVSGRGRGRDADRVLRAGSDAGFVPERMPIFVLIDRGSASASEIMAGALQDHGRATLIGERSFGKASVQQVIRPLPDNTAALITIQKYYTPKNRSLHKVGLKPDIKVRGIRASSDERYFLNKLYGGDFFKKFKRKHPAYAPRLLDEFLRETEKRGWKFSRTFARFLIKREYDAIASGKPDLDIDPQLRRAVKEVLNK